MQDYVLHRQEVGLRACLIFESAGCAVQPSLTLEVHPQSQVPGSEGDSPESSQFCIRHLLEPLCAPEPGTPRGAVVGDAAKVSGRQRRRPAMQADGVAEVQAKWRAAPSVRELSACCIRSCGGGGRANGRNEPGRRLGRQWRQTVAGPDRVVMHHRHPFESQSRYLRTCAARLSNPVSCLRLVRLLLGILAVWAWPLRHEWRAGPRNWRLGAVLW